MKEQYQLFWTAVMFYTRIPVPPGIDHAADRLNKATCYLPLIGWIVGGAMAALLYGLHFILPLPIVLLLTLAAGIWITGAFHEDGFADMCDGFGGGWTKAKILDIMKDSRIGTYGMAGLTILLLLKFYCLQSLPLPIAIAALLIAHPLSRLLAVTVIYSLPYVRENEDSKAKPVSKGITAPALLVAAILGLLPLLAWIGWQQQYWLLITIPAIWLARTYLVRLMRKWIGGYTGDCLGATQQVAETVIYLCFCIIQWKST